MLRFFLSLFVSALLVAENADSIVTARYVVTMDPQRRVLDNGAIAIQGDRIVAAGPRGDIDKRFQARARIDAGESVIIPGLINTHQHAPMALMRGIADDLRLQEWLTNYIFPAEARNVTPDFVRWGTRLACLEMLLAGTTTYADMYYFEDTIAEATREAGMRGVLGQTVIGFPVPDAKTPQDGLRRAEAFIRKYQHDPLIVPAVAPHAVYTTPDDILKASRELANRYNVPLLIHLSETRRENEELQAKRQTTPTQLLERLGVLTGRTLAAHSVWVNDDDLAILKKRGTGLAHCPSSNAKLASGVAPILKFLRSDLAAGLGTDGFSGSNNDASLFEEMDLAAKIQKITTLDPEALNARQVFEMATLRGARALGMEKLIGSLETGKRADLAVVSLQSPHAVPLYDIYSHLVYTLKAADVRHVFVNGKLVVKDARCLTLDAPRILSEARALQIKIQSSLNPRPKPD